MDHLANTRTSFFTFPLNWFNLTRKFLVLSTGKIDLTEFKSIELERIREYVEGLLNESSLRRIPNSKVSWLWHDEDELLRYQPELLDGFHERSVHIGFILCSVYNSVILSVDARSQYNFCH